MTGHGSSLAARIGIGLAAVAALSMAAMIAYVAGGPIRTNDFWFHLEAGEAYATQGPWPTADPMLHTAHADAPVQHEWLFGLGTYALQRSIGFHGLRAAHVAAVAIAFAMAWLVLRRAELDRATAWAGLAVFAALAWWRVVQLRPDLFSIPASLAVYALWIAPQASDGRSRTVSRASLLGAAGLAVVWANVHSLFALGPLLLASAGGGLALRWLLARANPPACSAEIAEDGARLRGLALPALVMTGASVLNPRGFAQHLTFFASSRDTAIWSIGDEWRTFQPFVWPELGPALSPLAWGLANASMAAVLAIGALRVARFARAPLAENLRRIDAVHLALGLAGCIALLVSIRFVWMAIFPALYVARSIARHTPKPAPLAAVVAATLALAALLPSAGHLAAHAQVLPRDLAGYLREPYSLAGFYPRGLHFLRDSGVEGNLFNRYTLGGFLGYWLSPRLRTFVDGRTEHYPPEVLDAYFRIGQQLEVRPGESALSALDRYGVDLYFGVGVPVEGEAVYTTARLERAEDWVQISRSVDHSIFLRRGAAGRENLERVADFYAQAGVPFDRDRGFDPVRAAHENPKWALQRGIVPESYEALRKVAQSGQPRARAEARDRLALLYYLLGDYERQMALDRRALSEQPAAFAPRARLVHSLLRAGRDAEAAEEALLLVRSHPSEPRAVNALRLVRAVEELRLDRGSRVPAAALINGVPLLSRDELQRFYGTGRLATGGRPDV
jgi:tetratricopeptide (TPR) repeat protein